MMGKRNRYSDNNSLEMTAEGIMRAHRILIDRDYERKVADVMAVMQGKRITRNQGLGSPVWRD
jgi:hypothetical protein